MAQISASAARVTGCHVTRGCNSPLPRAGDGRDRERPGSPCSRAARAGRAELPPSRGAYRAPRAAPSGGTAAVLPHAEHRRLSVSLLPAGETSSPSLSSPESESMLQVSAGQRTEGAAEERPEPGSERRAAPAASSSAPRPAAAGSTSLRAIGCRGEGTGGLRGGEGMGGGSGGAAEERSVSPLHKFGAVRLWPQGDGLGAARRLRHPPQAGALGSKWDRTGSALLCRRHLSFPFLFLRASPVFFISPFTAPSP